MRVCLRNISGHINHSVNYLNNYNPNIDWLGDGTTSDKIIKIIKENISIKF